MLGSDEESLSIDEDYSSNVGFQSGEVFSFV